MTNPSSSPQDSRTAASKLPAVLTSFVGRERELAEVTQWLASTRLLTLIGVGGCGKTRLALELALRQAAAFEDAVCWVDLASLSEPGLVTQTVAQALGLREAAHESSLETITNYLHAKQFLLVLDNCEHLLAACQKLVEALLRACSDLKLLATSREPLALAGELTWLVPALSLPDSTRLPRRDDHVSDELARYDAIRLFVERAKSVLPIFTLTIQNANAVAQVCQRLDGLPLAIELAAARVNVLAVQQIADRLDDRLALLTNGNRTALIPRHQTLRATLDWSYDLLPEPERILFRRLSVFAGGFNLEAAEVIGVSNDLQPNEILDLLSHLIDKSLVAADTQGRSEARYRLLETVRQYAAEKLRESGEDSELRNRHRDWCLALVEHAEPLLRGPEQTDWIVRLESEHDNLRAAMAWCRVETSAGIASAEVDLRLVCALFWFWHLRGHWNEGRHWLELALEQSQQSSPTPAWAKALYASGELARLLGDHVNEQRRMEQSVAAWRSLVAQAEATPEKASQARNAMRLSELKCGLALALTGLGNMAASHSDHSAARSLFDESIGLSQSIGARWELGYALRWSGEIFIYEGDYATARTRLDESLKIFRETGDRWGLGSALLWRGRAALPQADYEIAGAQLEQALAIFRELGDKWNIALSLNFLGETARSQGDDVRALKLYEETLAINRELGSKLGVHYSLQNLGYIALHRRDRDRATELFKEALYLNLERQDSLMIAHCLAGLAGVAAVSGVSEQAIQLFGKAQSMLDEIGNVWASTDRLEVERYLSVARAQLDADKFDSAWEIGRTLTLEQAVENAQSIGSGAHRERFPAPIDPLNERELEVLRLIADGLSNHEIADRLVIALSTVKWHLNNLFGKLAVHSRTQALARAKELGLL